MNANIRYCFGRTEKEYGFISDRRLGPWSLAEGHLHFHPWSSDVFGYNTKLMGCLRCAFKSFAAERIW